MPDSGGCMKLRNPAWLDQPESYSGIGQFKFDWQNIPEIGAVAGLSKNEWFSELL
jgi:hypothetical protein